MVNNFERRPTRSDHYQHLIQEAPCSNDMMESFPNEDSICNRLSGSFAYDERILELEDQLKEEFWRIVDMLTPRQRDVIKLYAEGHTQMEIAKILKVNQSSVTKSLHGNCDYRNGKTIYGGSKKKLNKIIQSDQRIIDILDKINALRAEKW